MAGAVTHLLTSAVRARCETIAMQIGQVNGLELAAAWIEELALASRDKSRK
jgi:hypothetical protein